MTAPKRRWFAFRLRTLFAAMTVFAMLTGWLVWNAVKVRERAEFIGSMRDLGAQLARVSPSPPRPPLPYLWSLMGAQPVEGIVLIRYKTTDAEFQRVEHLFPDAVVMCQGPAQRPRLDLPDLPQTGQPTHPRFMTRASMPD